MINFGWVRLPSCHWSKGPFRAAEWLIKKSFNKIFNLLHCFNCHFDKQANIRCSTGNISRPISLRDRNTTDQAIAMDRHQSYFRKRYHFFSGKKQGAVRTDQNIYTLIYNFFIVVKIFKIVTSLSIFSTVRPSLAQQRKLMKTINFDKCFSSFLKIFFKYA